jgi:hypothetical protein
MNTTSKKMAALTMALLATFWIQENQDALFLTPDVQPTRSPPCECLLLHVAADIYSTGSV